MNWEERQNTVLKIQTGDGKVYEPLWQAAKRTLEYNLAEFDFPEQDGTLVDRMEMRGRRFDLNFIFQGADHLDVAQDFETSSKDKRPWTIQHPIYGRIVVHPSSFELDQSRENISAFTGEVIETILKNFPRAVSDPVGQIQDDKLALDFVFIDEWPFTYVPSPASQNSLRSHIDIFRAEGNKVITDTESSNIFTNLYNDVFSSLQDATQEPVQQITKAQAFINSLCNFPMNVSTRLGALTACLNGFSTAIKSRSEKQIYEHNASMIISSMAVAASTPLPGNYLSRVNVLNAIGQILSAYNGYLATIDLLQSSNNSSPASYMPSAWGMYNLNSLVNYTISQLFALALGAKQERIIYLSESSNAIVLTHRFYGLDDEDINFNTFVTTNAIGLNEILNIPKGRRIVYYL